MDTGQAAAKEKTAQNDKRGWALLVESWYSLGNRQWWAYLFDSMLSLLLLIASAMITHAIKESALVVQIGVNSKTMALFSLTQIAYYPIAWRLFGRSLGMWLMSIKVVNLEMKRISSGQALLRFVAYCVLGSFFGLFLLSLFVDKKSRGWHDKVARTIVILDSEINEN